MAISLDEAEPEIKSWEKKKEEMKGWLHLRASEGIRSKCAADYFVLSTPVMVLVDSKTKNIIALPVTLSELKHALK